MFDLSLLSSTLCSINGQSENRADIIAIFDDENETVTLFRKAKTQWSPLTLIRLKSWEDITKNGSDSFSSFNDLKTFVADFILADTSTGGGGGSDSDKFVRLSGQNGAILMHPDFADKLPILVIVDSIPLLSGFSKPTLASTTINITGDTVMNNSNVLVLLQ